MIIQVIKVPKNVLDMQFKMVSSLRVYLTILQEPTRTYMRHHTQIFKNTHEHILDQTDTGSTRKGSGTFILGNAHCSVALRNKITWEEERRCDDIVFIVVC